MLMLVVMLVVAMAQQPAPPATPAPPELPVLKAGLGNCAADFTVKDATGQPLYLATVRVRVRYGFMSVKRMDLEIGTNSDGKARIEGLPEKARPLVYDVTKDALKTQITQEVATTCQGRFDVQLKN